MIPLVLLATSPPALTPNPALIAWPDAVDATASDMRPRFRVIAQYEVGQGKAYSTINAATQAARAYQEERWRADYLPAATPDYWVEILIHPGVYVENLTTVPQFCSIVGMGATVADVTITSVDIVAGGAASGTVVSGGMQHWERLTIIRALGTEGTWPKYPVHHTGHGRTTTNFVQCVFDNRMPGTTVGMDGGGGHTFTAYMCTLIGGGTNMHGPSEVSLPMKMSWVGCAAPAVNYAATGLDSIVNNTWPDDVWIVGGTVVSASVVGAATKLHIDPATATTWTTTGTKDALVSWPVPSGCTTAVTQAYYYGG